MSAGRVTVLRFEAGVCNVCKWCRVFLDAGKGVHMLQTLQISTASTVSQNKGGSSSTRMPHNKISHTDQCGVMC